MAIRYCKLLTPGQIREMHRLYNQSFQRIRTSESCFRERMGAVNAVLEERQGALLGYGLIQQNCLKLLAVAPEERGRGLGSGEGAGYDIRAECKSGMKCAIRRNLNCPKRPKRRATNFSGA